MNQAANRLKHRDNLHRLDRNLFIGGDKSKTLAYLPAKTELIKFIDKNPLIRIGLPGRLH